MSDFKPAERPRRADARQNSAAILDAAARLLAERPDAGLAAIARAAGVSRQTLYAHFPSREALIGTLVDQATERVLAALDAARLDVGPADEALVRFMEVGWQALATDPFLLHLTSDPDPEEDRQRHAPLFGHLERLITRGKREGVIDPELSSSWILTLVLAIGHAAGEEVRSGRMTSEAAVAAIRRSIPRVIAPDRG